MLDLIVDDGVPDRGHRNYLFNPALNYVGIATGALKNAYKQMTTIDYAAVTVKPWIYFSINYLFSENPLKVSVNIQ